MTSQTCEQITAGTPAEGGLSFEPIPPAELQQIRAAGRQSAAVLPA